MQAQGEWERLFLELGEESPCQIPPKPRALCSLMEIDGLDSARLNLAQLFACSTNIFPSEELQAGYMSLFSGAVLLAQHSNSAEQSHLNKELNY